MTSRSQGRRLLILLATAALLVLGAVRLTGAVSWNHDHHGDDFGVAYRAAPCFLEKEARKNAAANQSNAHE